MQQPSQENADGVNNQTGNQLEYRNYNKKIVLRLNLNLIIWKYLSFFGRGKSSYFSHFLAVFINLQSYLTWSQS